MESVEVKSSSATVKKKYATTGSFLHSEGFWGMAFILPFMLGILVFLLVPLISTIVLSFTSYNIIETPKFVGAENYVDLIKNQEMFRKSFINSLKFALGLVPLNIILALLCAVLLNNVTRFSTLFRGIYFLPVITSEIVFAIVWVWIWNYDYGLINYILNTLGIPAQNWLGDSKWAMFAVIITRVIKNLGMNVVIILAAMQSIPKMYYEAADLDGANSIKKFIHVTIPELSPVIFMTVMVTVIGAFKVFAQIYAMTDGGPAGATNVMMLYLYKLGFKELEYGKASAVGVIIFLVVLLFTIIQWALRKKLVYQEES